MHASSMGQFVQWTNRTEPRSALIVVLVRYQKYRSIAILAKVRYRYLVVPIFSGIANAHYSIPSIFRYSTSSPFDKVDAKAQHRC